MNNDITPDEWAQYFQQEPTSAMEWIQNLRDAVKAGWYDAGLADTHMNRLQIEMDAVKRAVNSQFRAEQESIKEGFRG